MKKIICCILLSVCLCFTLVVCDITEETGTMDKESIQKINNNGIYEFIDPDTEFIIGFTHMVKRVV